MDKDYAFFLRHIPVAGTAPSVKIPDTVQLSHTGSVSPASAPVLKRSLARSRTRSIYSLRDSHHASVLSMRRLCSGPHALRHVWYWSVDGRRSCVR
eukprot:1171892-Rhodomonas_salina.2